MQRLEKAYVWNKLGKKKKTISVSNFKIRKNLEFLAVKKKSKNVAYI